ELAASMTIKQSVVERNYRVGVSIFGADVTMDTTVVRDTKTAMDGVGVGVFIDFSDETSTRGNATIRSSLIEGNLLNGVAVLQSDATIEATVVRDTQIGVSCGEGVNIFHGLLPGGRSSLTVRSSLVEDIRGLGFAAVFSDVLIESTVVRGTLVDSLGHFGF